MKGRSRIPKVQTTLDAGRTKGSEILVKCQHQVRTQGAFDEGSCSMPSVIRSYGRPDSEALAHLSQMITPIGLQMGFGFMTRCETMQAISSQSIPGLITTDEAVTCSRLSFFPPAFFLNALNFFYNRPLFLLLSLAEK